MPSEHASAPDHVELALAEAAAALPWFRATTGAERAALLTAISAELKAVANELAELAARETGLGRARLLGEIEQTRVNLGELASWVGAGREKTVVHDPADLDFPRGARPDMRRIRVPVGVALNFAASNFPFAFSVAGVDSAAALAVGCPVVVKAHPGHPETSRATAVAVRSAASDVFGDRESPLQLIEGEQDGVTALRDARVAVATFTGSESAGRHLAAVAAQRATPIPFYGELGSVNPVVITAGAVRERGAALAQEYVDEVAFSGGQVCVKPGLVFVPLGHGLDDEMRRRAASTPEHRLLYPSLGIRYEQRRAEVMAVDGARVVHAGVVRIAGDGHVYATPTILAIPYESARAHAPTVTHEVFGPLSVVVECDDVEGVLPSLPDWLPGSLTACVHLTDSERGALGSAVKELQYLVGRIVVNEWPGAVYATPAQHHGGPSPATTLDTVASTSVGQMGLARFQRAVTWQNAPDDLLP